jgi:integrase
MRSLATFRIADMARTQRDFREMAQHLKDPAIRDFEAPAKGNRIVYDKIITGFGLRVTKAGAKAFILNYRTKGGRERRITIGSFPDWQTTAARDKAKELRRRINNGEDPLADIEAEREAPTVKELCKRFEDEHLPRKRPGTVVDYKSMVARHILPHFGPHVKVKDVTFADIDRLHRKITSSGHRRRANTVVAVLSKMFGLSIRWGMRDDNPARGIERNTEIQRKRHLVDDELARLLKALAEHEDKQAANIIRVLLMTGARRGEVLGMRWADVDLSKGTWTKPASSVKQDRDHVAPLSAPVRQLLYENYKQQIDKRRVLGEFVFPGIGDSGHVVEIKKSWRTICKNAGIEGLRIHDLRHSFASELVSGGATLPLIGALLGHSSASTTQRYAHMFQDPQRAAVEKVGAAISAAGNAPVEPTPLKRGR